MRIALFFLLAAPVLTVAADTARADDGTTRPATAWQASRRLSFVASLGAVFGGRLALEDASGTALFHKSYDPAVLAGFGLRFEL